MTRTMNQSGTHSLMVSLATCFEASDPPPTVHSDRCCRESFIGISDVVSSLRLLSLSLHQQAIRTVRCNPHLQVCRSDCMGG